MENEKNIEALRKLFPVTNHWVYLYNGSIHPCPLPVAEAMQSFLTEWQNGGEAAFFQAYESFNQLKEKFGALIHGDARNIVVTESTTAALNLAARLIDPSPGRTVVVTDLTFMSNSYSWLASHPSIEVRFVESKNGKVLTEDIEAMMDERASAVSICAVTVGSGFRFNLQEVYALTRKHKVPLIVDAAQAVGLIDIDVNDPPVEFLATTASKWLMGPAGIGFLHVSDRYLTAVPPMAGWFAAANVSDWDVRNCRLHRDATRFQGGIPNLIGIVGALKGIELLEQIGRDFIEKRVGKLTSYLYDGLEKTGVSLWTPKAENERAGIIFFRTPFAEKLHQTMKEARIYCGHFLEGIRVDPQFYNTYGELDKFINLVKTHVKRFG